MSAIPLTFVPPLTLPPRFFSHHSSSHARRPRTTSLALPSPSTKRPSPAAEKSSALMDWLKQNGMYLSSEATWGRAKHPLGIADETTDDGEYSGRGLIAMKGIVQGEPIFEVPFELVITKPTAVAAFPILEDAGEYIAIACFLIHERSLGSKSFWKPYLDVLPQDEELIPLFRWNEDDLKLLQGSPCISAAKSLRAKLANEFSTAEHTYFSRDRVLFPEHIFTSEAWEWAFAILFSRAIMLTAEQVIGLVPYADLLNHNPFCSTYIDVHKRSFSDNRVVALYTDRPYSRMDQVFVTYGPKSNSDLLLLYGFVTDRNPFDAVEIFVSLSDDDPLYHRKKEFVDESGVGSTATFPLYKDRYPMELIEFLRFCVSTEDEFENSDFGDFINEDNETLVARSLIDACRVALDGYPQSREEDDKLIADRGMFKMFSMKQRWAVRQRRAEKRILERTILNIEQEMTDPKFMFTESKE